MTFTALSIIQPWPWVILRPDIVEPGARAALRAGRWIKDCENRDWETPVRGWVLIHASSRRYAQWDYTAAALFAAKRGVDVPLRDNLPYGAVVGAARVDECTWTYRSPWFRGPRAFILGASMPFAEPVVCAGFPRFFDLPERGSEAAGVALWHRLAAAVRAAGLAQAFKLSEEAMTK